MKLTVNSVQGTGLFGKQNCPLLSVRCVLALSCTLFSVRLILYNIFCMKSEIAELKIEDEKVGTGREVKSGDTVVIHYTGWLDDGEKFDSSVDRGVPFETKIGVGRVIEGWDKGVVGMKIGGKRKLTIPSEMGYGEHGAGMVIPPFATLLFDVELLDIK